MRKGELTEMMLNTQTWHASFFTALNSSAPEHCSSTPAIFSHICHHHHQQHQQQQQQHKYYTEWSKVSQQQLIYLITTQRGLVA